MKYVVCRIGLLAAVVSLMSPLPAGAAEPSGIIISEINWAGSARSTADEWLELANIGDAPVDIGGWLVSGAASGGGAISLAENTVVASGDTLLVSNYPMGDSSTLAIEPQLVTNAISLANRALSLLLIAPDGTIVDSVTDAGEIEFGSSENFSSMERDLNSFAWVTATQSLNLIDGQLGTPGSISGAVPEEETVAEEVELEIGQPVELDAVVTEETQEELEIVPPIEDVRIVESTEAQQEEKIDEEANVDLPSEPTLSPILTTEVDEIEVPATETVSAEEPDVIEPEIPKEEISVEPTTEQTVEPVVIPIQEADEPKEETIPSTAPIEYVPVTTTSQKAVEAPVTTETTTEETAPITEPEQEAEAPAVPRIGKVLLSEFVSIPAAGQEEWIEYVNADSFTIDVTGWSVVDASGKATLLPSATIAPGEYLSISKPLGKLNNGGDTIILRDSNGTIIDSITYSSDNAPGLGESLAWNGNAWEVTSSLTPNAENAFAPDEIIAAEVPEVTAPKDQYEDSGTEHAEGPDVSANTNDREITTTVDNLATNEKVTIVAAATAPAEKTSATSSKSTTKKSTAKTKKSSAKKVTAPSFRTITSLEDAALEEHVRYTGTLIALPGTFGRQVAALDGAMLYMHKADWPNLQLGDLISVEGIISESRSEKRIKVTADALTVIGNTDLISGVLNESSGDAPALVNIAGRILGREGDTITVDVNGETITVRAATNTGITWGGLTTASISVTGVLRTVDGKQVLMPRSPDDVQFLQEETISAPPSASAPGNARPWIGAGLLTSSSGALGYWFLRSRRLTINS